MAARARQSRRTPQSSSGTITSQETSAKPPGYVHEHARSSSGLAHSHHSNPSLPTLPYGRTDSPNDRIIKSLVDKLNAKLPCYSGYRLSDLEENESVNQLVEGLVQLSRRSINHILLCFLEVLNKLNSRYLASKPVLDVLESELFVLRLMIRLLTFHWNTHVGGPEPASSTQSNTDSFDSASTPPPAPISATSITSLPSPPYALPVLDDKVAEYALFCVCTYLRRAGPSRIEHLILSERTEELDRLREMRIFERDTAVLHGTHHVPVDGGLILDPLSSHKSGNEVPENDDGGHFRFPLSRAPVMSFRVPMNGNSRVAPYIPSALTVGLCSVTGYSDILAYLAHLAGLVIYRISATNWSNVLSRIKLKIRYLAGDPQDEGDITELLFIIYSLINKDRLIEFLQLLQSLLVNMKPSSQCAIAVILRLVIWRWINDFGDEYAEVFQSSRRRLEGQPERIFDVLYQLTTSVNKRMLWPTLATLLAISPERLQAAEAALTGTLVYGKRHNNLLEVFHGAITTQSKLGETVMRCYNDICKAAYLLPPVLADGTLHALASDLADELKSRLSNPPESKPFYESFEPIDVNLYAESIVTILRYNYELALKIFRDCLEPSRSPAVKLCIVRALTIYVVEAVTYTWQPPLDNSIYQFIAPRLRYIMRELFGTTTDMSSFPSVLREKERERERGEKDENIPQVYDDRKDLLLAIQTLWRVDNGFLFSGLDESSAKVLVSNSTNIVHKNRDPSVQASVLRTFGTVLSRISDPSAEYIEEMNFFMFHSAFMVMRGTSLKILENPDDLELGKMNMGTSLAILSQLLDTTSLHHVEWKYNEERTTCLAVLEIALLILLTSARIDICSFAARGLRLMAQVGQDSIIPGPTYFTDDKPASFMTLIESVGDPKSLVLGRVEFQKRARQVAGPLACPCISQLAAWREGYFRWSFLRSLIYPPDARSSSEKSNSFDALLFGKLTFDERSWTWENLTLMLAVTSGSCLVDDPSLNPPSEYRLPFRQGFSDEKPSRLMRRFINELVDILMSHKISAQLMARDALGSELNSKWFPLLFDILDSKMRLLTSSNSNEDVYYDSSLLAFIDQVISVLKLVLERITIAESTALTVDLGNMLIMLSKFISQPFERNFDVRIKTRFCAILDIIREKMLPMKNDNVVRNNLFEVVTDWVWEPDLFIPEDTNGSRAEPMANYMDVTIASLKTLVNLSEDLQLMGSSGKTTDDMDLNVPSRLFSRYLGILLKEVEPKRKEGFPIYNAASVSFGGYHADKHSSQVQALVVAAVTNLLSANPTAGAKHVLSLSFNSSARLRTVFCHVFSQVLSRNVNFDEYHETFLLTSRKSRLCELVKEHDLLLYAIVDLCPSNETEAMSAILLNLFNTQRSTLNLLRVVISRQVAIAENPTDLFRANDICGRIFSGFAKSHGYVYLRSIISPLIVAMQSSPEGTSYEVDPSKIKPEDTQKQNASNLQRIAAVFLEIMTESWVMVPDLLRESCRVIFDAVKEKWEVESYTPIGAFFFLRFVVPAITSPETIDLEIPRDEVRSQSIKRGLILVAKIVQNIVNNIYFAKEAHMKMLNGLLTENVPRVVQFYRAILASSPAERNRIHSDELLGSLYDEADTLVLHRFFENHKDRIGELLLGYKAPPSVITPSKSGNGKMIWDDVCSLLLDGNSTMRPPVLSDRSFREHQGFRSLYEKHVQTSAESVRDIFQNVITWGDQPNAFVLYIASIDVETVDFELLMHYVFKTIREPILIAEKLFDVIVDFTGFTASSEIPLSWVRTLIENTPSEIPEHFRHLYLLNIDAAAQAFLRKLHYLSPGLRFCKRTMAVSSVSDLTNNFHPSTVATLELANRLEEESKTTCFTCQQHLHGKLMTPTTIYVGTSHLRIVSVKPQPIYPGLSCKTVEIVPYTDIRDIALSTTRNDHHEFVIRRFADGSILTFWSIEKEREKFVEMVRVAKAHIKPNESVSLNERARHSVISTSLLATAFYGICDENEFLRESAFSLLSALCKFLKFDVVSIVSLKDAGVSVPINTTAYICSFSERLSNFVPALTLDFMAEICLGFEVATHSQRILVLQYMHPWIKNLAYFGDPAHPLYDESQSKLKDIIGSLIDISTRFADIFPCTLRWVWPDFNKFDSQLLNLVLDALIQTAIDGGIGSQRCEQIGDILIAISTIDVRARVLKKLKAILSKPGRNTRSLTKSSFWPETTAISRLLLKTGYAPRLSLHAQLYMPEAVHFVTMLCSTGSLYVKSTVYGIAMNLIQNLRVLRLEAGASVAMLDELMKEMGTNEVLNNFGLMKVHPNSDIVSAEKCPDQIPIAALESITQLFLRALTYGAGETQEGDESGNGKGLDVPRLETKMLIMTFQAGLLNVWRARWMSLVSSTAFQLSPYVQYRSFVVMGVLASSGVLSIDENMLYQTLIAFKTALQSGQDEDTLLVMSMIHFMARVLPGFESNSSYLPRLFWLTLALLQSTFSSLYEESANLLGIIVETMSKQGYFLNKRMSLVLLDAREDISVILTQLDAMMGVSFDAAFSFSLASIIFRAMRSPALQPTAKRLLRNVIKIAAESLRLEASRGRGRTRLSLELAADGNMVYVDYEVMGYFLALLPFACTSSSYRALLRDAGITEGWWPPLSPNPMAEDNDEDDDGTPVVDPSIFHLEEGDNHTPLLIISFLFAISDCYQGTESEKAFIFALLVRLGEMYPDITAAAVVHFLAAPHRGEWLIGGLVEAPPARSDAIAVISSSVQALFRIAMTNPVWSTMLVPTVQGSLDEQRTSHWRALEELDMHILAAHWKVIPKSEAWKILQWIPALLDGVTITS